MNVEKSFAYPFEDKDWVRKLGLGALISMVPILNFAWSGYMVDILRNVMSSHPEPLPTWDDLGKKFNEGLILFGAGLIYASPILVGVCLPLGITAFSSLFSRDGNVQDLSQTITEVGVVVFFGLLCVLLLYGLVLSILYPAVLVLFSQEGTFASCFKLRQAFDLISKDAGPFFTAWALSIAASLGVGLIAGFVNLVVSWIPCIGWIVGLVLSVASVIYSNIVYAHLFGQFGKSAFEGRQLVPPNS